MANSPLLQIPQVAPNQSNKETTINDGFSIIERSLNDIRGIDMTAGDVELNIEDYTRAFLFEVSGNAAPADLTVPASTRLFSVYNAGTQTVTVICKDSVGMTADIPAESYVVLFNNGTDIRKISDSAASGQVSAFLSLPDTPNSFEGMAGMALVVNALENGLDFGTISVAFTQLTDAPSSYTGQGGKVVRVKADVSGLEFTTYIDAFTKLGDTPTDYIGHGGKMVVVTPGEDGLEFQDIPEAKIQETRVYTLDNAGFEDGTTTNWLLPSTSGDVWAVVEDYGLLLPSEGQYFAVFGWGQGSEPTSIGYRVELLDMAYAEEIDEEAELVVTVGMASPAGDFGTMEFEFLDESDAVLSSVSSPQYPTLTEEFTDRTYRAAIPVGTRAVNIYVHAEKNVDSSVDPDNLTFAVDGLEVSIRLTLSQINQFIELFDTPLSYEGMAGRMVVVNNTEDGVEFAVAPAVRDTFLQLTDTPSAYTGQGGKFLRVTAGADAIEFHTANFTDLAGTPSSFSGHSGKAVRVNSGESALEFFVHNLASLIDVDLTGVQDGYVLEYNAVAGEWVAVEPSSGGGGGTTEIEINDQTASYQLVLADAGKYVRMNVAGANNLTVPDNATEAFPIGTQIVVRQVGAGQTTIVAAGGVTINTAETLKLRKQGSTATLVKVATDTWDLTGDLELVP